MNAKIANATANHVTNAHRREALPLHANAKTAAATNVSANPALKKVVPETIVIEKTENATVVTPNMHANVENVTVIPATVKKDNAKAVIVKTVTAKNANATNVEIENANVRVVPVVIAQQ